MKGFYKVSLLLIGSLLTACTDNIRSQRECDARVFDINGRPCWVNQLPKEGVVVSSARHVIPANTDKALFDRAIEQLSASVIGLEVARDSIVNKHTTVNKNGVADNSSVISFTVISSAKKGQSQHIKASVKDQWSDGVTQKKYLWVILEKD